MDRGFGVSDPQDSVCPAHKGCGKRISHDGGSHVMFFLSPGTGRRGRDRDKNRTSTRSLTDRASDYGSEGCRFESCRVHTGKRPPERSGGLLRYVMTGSGNPASQTLSLRRMKIRRPDRRAVEDWAGILGAAHVLPPVRDHGHARQADGLDQLCGDRRRYQHGHTGCGALGREAVGTKAVATRTATDQFTS